MNNLFHSGRILGIALLSAAVPLCMAANYQNNFDADRMDRHWKSTDSSAFAPAAVATGELEQANGWLFYSAAASDLAAPATASYTLDGYRVRCDADWRIRVQAVVDAGRHEQRPLAAGVNVRMAIGISVGDRVGTAPFARYAVGIAASEAGTFTELSFASRAAGRSDVTLSKLGRRRPISDHELRALVISYDVRADTLTMSAGDITRTIRRFRAQLDRRGIADDFVIDLSADSTGISADRIAMFDNFSVAGAVSQ